MFRRSCPDRPRRAVLAVERLEDRQLLSVSFSPAAISTTAINHRSGFLSVYLVSDDAAARTLLTTAGTLNVTLTEGSINRDITSGVNASKHADLNGDRISDLAATIPHRTLKNLPAGTVTLTFSNGKVSESGTLVIFVPTAQGHKKKA